MRFLFPLLIVLFTIGGLQAQQLCDACVVDSTCISSDPNVGIVCPTSIDDTAGTDLDVSITFDYPNGIRFQEGDTLIDNAFFPITVPQGFPLAPFNAPVLGVTLTGIDNLPPGVTYECDSALNGCQYAPVGLTIGCVKLCGTIDCEYESDTLVLNFDYEVKIPQNVIDLFTQGGGLPIPIPSEVTLPFTYNVLLNVEQSTNLSLDLTANKPNTISEGEEIVFNATPGFTTYQWSDGSTADTLAANPTESTTYSVTATDDNGCEQESTFDVTVVPTVTSIGLTGGVDMKMYPNPSTGKLYIDFTAVTLGKNLNLSIFDGRGKEVINHVLPSSTNSPFEINTGSLSSGIYLVKIYGGDVNINQKLFVE